MSKNKNTTNTTFKTPLLNDCTNHLAFQLNQKSTDNKAQRKTADSYHEALFSDVVTSEFIRGYN